MIRRIKLIRHVGKFKYMDTIGSLDLPRLVLIYGENGRGKTTLSSILRSLASGEPSLIQERHRLGAAQPPKVVLECDDIVNTRIFESGTWNLPLANLMIFDDFFVDQNVCSGLEVGARHRQNLHEFILGERGVTLNQRVDQLIEQVEEHNRALAEIGTIIQDMPRSGLSVDEFSALPRLDGIDARIAANRQSILVPQEESSVQANAAPEIMHLPGFSEEEILQVLSKDLEGLQKEAEDRVKSHVSSLAEDGENWLSVGMGHFSATQELIVLFAAKMSPKLHWFRITSRISARGTLT